MIFETSGYRLEIDDISSMTWTAPFESRIVILLINLILIKLYNSDVIRMPIFNQSQPRNSTEERVVQLIHLKSQKMSP